MIGKLLKQKDEWFVEYLESSSKSVIPVHPSELKIEGLWKFKNKQIEFEVVKEYKGFRHTGDRDNKIYVEIYQNYAKLNIE
jgi:hypothetical protein